MFLHVIVGAAAVLVVKEIVKEIVHHVVMIHVALVVMCGVLVDVPVDKKNIIAYISLNKINDFYLKNSFYKTLLCYDDTSRYSF